MLRISCVSVLLCTNICSVLALLEGYAHPRSAPALSARYIGDIQLIQAANINTEKELIHFHLYGVDRIASPLTPTLMAKCGMRSSGASTLAMSRLLESTFLLRGQSDLLGQTQAQHAVQADREAIGGGGGERHDCPAHSTNRYLVGLLVYMWVNPRHRGLGMGDAMLRTVMQECRVRNYTHLLLAHQDDGRGRLVEYYQRRGFVSINRFVEGGMVRVVE
jgi:GNAT superfamily N-acetyltransferase